MMLPSIVYLWEGVAMHAAAQLHQKPCEESFVHGAQASIFEHGCT